MPRRLFVFSRAKRRAVIGYSPKEEVGNGGRAGIGGNTNQSRGLWGENFFNGRDLEWRSGLCSCRRHTLANGNQTSEVRSQRSDPPTSRRRRCKGQWSKPLSPRLQRSKLRKRPAEVRQFVKTNPGNPGTGRILSTRRSRSFGSIQNWAMSPFNPWSAE